jgi:uncharacterized RDD family membrane protein YckC
MAITFACEQCGQRYQVDDSHAGKRIKCKKCEATVAVPGAAVAVAPAARPPVQTFGQAPPKSKPPLQTFGAPPPPGRAAAPPPAKEPPPKNLYGLDEDDAPGDPYGLEEPVAPAPVPTFTAEEEENPYTAPRAKVKTKKSKGSRLEYGGFLRRLGALLLDALVMIGMGMAVGAVLGGTMGLNPKDPGSLARFQLVTQLILVCIYVLYFAGMHSSAEQATVGKKACGLKVTDLSGQPIGFGRAVLREIVKQLLGAVCIGTLVSLITVIATSKKQALHDMIVGTVVVRR